MDNSMQTGYHEIHINAKSDAAQYTTVNSNLLKWRRQIKPPQSLKPPTS
jgi:hypothetical protein